MSAFADRLNQVDADLATLGVSEDRIAATRARVREAYPGDLGRIDALLESLGKGSIPARVSAPHAAAAHAPANVPSRSTLEILADELEEEEELEVDEDLEVEEVALEAEPAPSEPVAPAKPALTESVLFGVSSLEGALDQIEAEALAQPAVPVAEGSPAEDLAAMLEGDTALAADLASLEESPEELVLDADLGALLAEDADAAGPEEAPAPAPEEGEGEAKKGFFRKLFG